MWKPGFWLVPAGFYVRATLASRLNSPVMATSLWAQNSHGHLTLETEFWQWVSGGGWDVSRLPLHFQDVWFALMLSSLFVPCMKGALRVEWVRAHVLWRPFLGWVSWSSSQRHPFPRMLCWKCFHMRAVHVQLPLETSMATDSWDCEGAAGSLYTFALTALLTSSPGTDQTQVRDSEQQDLGCLLPFEPTTPSRPKVKMVLITVFAHSSAHLFTFYFLVCFALEPWNFLIYFEYELLMWYMLCNFSVG